jgi:hypothetical protein
VSALAARGDQRRRRLLLPAAALIVAVVAGAILYFTTRPQSLPEKLSDWIAERERSCLGGKPTIERTKPAARPDLYPDLLPHAESLAVVGCDYGGPVTIVLTFRSRGDLTRAFASSKSARRSRWCFTGREAFDGSGLDRGQLDAFCRRVDGTLH